MRTWEDIKGSMGKIEGKGGGRAEGEVVIEELSPLHTPAPNTDVSTDIYPNSMLHLSSKHSDHPSVLSSQILHHWPKIILHYRIFSLPPSHVDPFNRALFPLFLLSAFSLHLQLPVVY